MADSTIDRKAIKAKEKRDKLVQQRRLETTLDLMSRKGGREWILGLLEACHIFEDPFTGDALLEAFRKGERNVGLRILDDIMRSSTDEYIQMMRERNERDTANVPSDGDESDAGERSDGEEPRGYDEGPRPATGSDIYGPEKT